LYMADEGIPGVRVTRAAMCGILSAAVALPLAHARSRNAVHRVWGPVFIYHHVTQFRPSDDAIERGLTITPQQFDGELSYLASHHYRTVSAADAVSRLLEGRKLPAKHVILSFDDGYSDMYTNVYPQLRRRHMTATFFIPSGLIGKPRYLTWRQLEDMSRHGMDIEAHSVTHPDLTVVPRPQVRGEIYGSRQTLQRRLHTSVRIFAYPYGTYNSYILKTLRKAGYLAAFTTSQGWWLRSSHLLTLPRVYVDNDDTLPIFVGRLKADPVVLAQDPT
jgi:peptidoglycan/xylan/chitin deacetylase (PgdA/CDA1 family)